MAERHQAFHLATQRDNRLQARIGKDVKKETAAMKAIAVGTLTFLPATFVSVGELSKTLPHQRPTDELDWSSRCLACHFSTMSQPTAMLKRPSQYLASSGFTGSSQLHCL